ncbi:MAG: hypothetical protein IK025_03485 [Bacteroidales bacterium]|nr:hypothetical protein [Bacteroidales bacterium]
MKRLMFILVIVLPAFIIGITSCGPSKTDLEWESVLKGYWKPLNEETGELCTSVPYYHFGDSANGSSKYYKYDYTDTMKWEIRRKQMNVYYEKAVDGYYIGYNQYNSRSLMHIRSVSENEVLMSQLYNSGVQSDYKLVRITPEEYYSVYTGTVVDTSGNSGSHPIYNTF